MARLTVAAARLGAWTTAAAALVGAALARSGEVVCPREDEVVTVGSVVEVVWHPLPREAKEMELFLSLDGGTSYPLRLTPQLPPGWTRLAWVVPHLPTPAARLRLRVGIPGWGEVDAPPSPVFRIVAPARGVAAPVALREGERWLGWGLEPLPLPTSSWGEKRREVRAGWTFSGAAEGPRLPRPRPVATSTPPLLARRASSGAPAGAALPPLPPSETTPLPLRN